VQPAVVVRLHAASLPAPLGFFASHYWFTVSEGARCDRWEVWQRPDAGGVSVGHLHCNLKGPHDGVGGGPACLYAEWEGAVALRLKEVLEKAATEYPFRNRYAPWPGPNSNTFASWVLRRAGIDLKLPWKAIGRHYPCPDT
jgi:hypothetical protein